MTDYSVLGETIAGQLTTTSILWALHESVVWAFFRASNPDSKLGHRLQAITLVGALSILFGLAAFVLLLFEVKDWALVAFLAGLSFTVVLVIVEAIHYAALVRLRHLKDSK